VNIAQHLERAARWFADRPALRFGDRSWTYGELEAQAAALAGGFLRLGLAPGERVGLHLPNWPEFVIAYYALQKVGLVPLSLNAAYRREELEYIIRDADASAVITADPLAAHLPPREALPRVRHWLQARQLEALSGPPQRAVERHRDETAAILYTSATTGRPKGVMLTHANLVSNAYATVHHLRMTEADRGLCALPLFHCFGQNFIMNALVTCGGLLVLQERFVPTEFAAAVRHHGITLFYGVPTMYIVLLGSADRYDFSSVRIFFSAAASLPADVERRWQAVYGRPIHQGYGLTESSPFASYNHEVAHRPGSVGTPIENVEMKVADESGRELPDGEPGEIWIRGPNVMKGYFGQPDATADVLRDGWLRSGDIGYRDADGYFYLVDRVKDMINVAGFKVFPREVEEVLFRHPAVKEAAVLGMPDPVRGEAVRAFVVLNPGARVTAEELQALCRDALAPYKVPERLEFLEALPKSPSGKILKKELRLRP
jgi:long-chain acyl-CoA synthetase